MSSCGSAVAQVSVTGRRGRVSEVCSLAIAVRPADAAEGPVVGCCLGVTGRLVA